MPAVDGAYAKCTSAALAEVPDKEASLIDKTLVVQTNPISCHEQLLQAARLLAQQSRTYYLLMTGKPSVADASGCTRELVHYALQYHTCARNLIAACPTSRSKRLSGPCFLPLQSVRSVLSAGGALRLRASEVGLVEEAINHLDQLPVAAGAAAAQRMRENAETIADARQELKQESLTRISPTLQTPFPLCITGQVFSCDALPLKQAAEQVDETEEEEEEEGEDEEGEEEEDGDEFLKMAKFVKPILLTLDSLANLLRLGAQYAEKGAFLSPTHAFSPHVTHAIFHVCHRHSFRNSYDWRGDRARSRDERGRDGQVC
tara:strand:+ start:15 stop:965 length:951 start_codon:yes stop_codon:yes gene_type:complete